jgi:hypothetical protein
MPSWHERFVSKARTDSVLRRKIHELARLDALAMSTASQALTDGWTQNAAKVDRLCDEVAQRVAQSGEDVDEAAQWISYHVQDVARSLPVSSGSIAGLSVVVLAVVVGVVVYRSFHSWYLAVLGALAVLSVNYWIRSMSRR